MTDPASHNSPSERDDDCDFAFQLVGVEAERARRFEVWHAHPDAATSEERGRFAYTFMPVGVGTVVRVRCLVCKRGRDLTDYSTW